MTPGPLPVGWHMPYIEVPFWSPFSLPVSGATGFPGTPGGRGDNGNPGFPGAEGETGAPGQPGFNGRFAVRRLVNKLLTPAVDGGGGVAMNVSL